ncbi:MAG: helix-turn-helix domain-containing protein [Eubacterium sp.]|nr:helix-turn-helix domain-containing protein [Eubacterium sp.]
MNKIYYADLPHRAVAVYLYLQSRADRDGKCFPSVPTIASDLKLSKSTVKRAIADLEKSGFISKERRYRKKGGNSSNMYFIRPP